MPGRTLTVNFRNSYHRNSIWTLWRKRTFTCFNQNDFILCDLSDFVINNDLVSIKQSLSYLSPNALNVKLNRYPNVQFQWTHCDQIFPLLCHYAKQCCSAFKTWWYHWSTYVALTKFYCCPNKKLFSGSGWPWIWIIRIKWKYFYYTDEIVEDDSNF